MAKQFKPSGYNSLSPYFIIDDASRFVEFLKHVFSATELRRYDNSDGTIMHMELRIDDSVIMIGDSSERFPAVTHVVHLYVLDVDQIFNKVIELGCSVVETPSQREGDPDKRGTFKDFAGNMWSVGT